MILFRYFGYDSFIYTTGFHKLISKMGFCYQLYVGIYRYIIGFVGSGMIMLIIKIFYDNNCMPTFIKHKLVQLGKISLQVYAVQHVILEVIAADWYKLFVINSGYNPLTMNTFHYDFIITPLLALSFAIIISIFVKIMDNIHVGRYIFGR